MQRLVCSLLLAFVGLQGCSDAAADKTTSGVQSEKIEIPPPATISQKPEEEKAEPTQEEEEMAEPTQEEEDEEEKATPVHPLPSEMEKEWPALPSQQGSLAKEPKSKPVVKGKSFADAVRGSLVENSIVRHHRAERTTTEDTVEDVDSTELKDVDLSDDGVVLTQVAKELAKEEATPVEGDASGGDQWCCCDPMKVQEDRKMICLTDEGYKTLLEVEDPKADVATPDKADKDVARGHVLVEDKTVRSCVDDTPQPCAGDECLKVSYVTFAQRKKTSAFDREYTLPVEKWAAAKYHSKYYSNEAQQGRKHVLETESGNVYAKVAEHGLAKNKFSEGTNLFCTRYETYAYWKFAETDEDDGYYERATNTIKNTRNAWSCVEKKKCVQYVTVADACGAKNVVHGDGEEKDLEGLTGLGGELYELVGRKGQCEDPEVKEGKWADFRKWTKDFSNTAGAGSQCPSGMFHSSKGKQNSPNIPYRFCDCSGECK